MTAIAEAGWANVKYGKPAQYAAEPGIFERLAAAYRASRLHPVVNGTWKAVLTAVFAIFGFFAVWYLAAALVPALPWPFEAMIARLSFWPAIAGLLGEIGAAIRAFASAMLAPSGGGA